MRSPEARSRLDRLVAEVRAQKPPEPAQLGLPARLRKDFASAGGAARGTLPRSAQRTAAARWLPRLGLAALLAGAAAFVIGRPAGPVPEQSGLPDSVASLDGQALDVGVLVVASERPRLVEHSGRASWVLAPGSEARLLSAVDGMLRVSLERGSLDAHVQPSSRSASFVVQAAGTEVAVHGTLFRVTLLPESTRVAVAQGQVQVRPLGQSTGMLLGPGMQADFVAGVPDAVPAEVLPAEALPAPPPVERGAVPAPPLPLPEASAARSAHSERSLAPGAGARVASAPSPERAPVAPAAAPGGAPAATPKALGSVPDPLAEQAVQTVTRHVQDCFRLHIPGSSGLGIEASTQLALSVEPNGVLLQADFEPPLAPAVEACVATQLAQLKVAPSPAGYRVEREIRLRR